MFYENVRALTGSSLAKEGTILLPWGSDGTIIPLVSGEDVARVAAGVLTAPSVRPGSSYPVIGEVLALRDIDACARLSAGFWADKCTTTKSRTTSGTPGLWNGDSISTPPSICRSSRRAIRTTRPEFGDVEADQHGRNPGRQKTQDRSKNLCARSKALFKDLVSSYAAPAFRRSQGRTPWKGPFARPMKVAPVR